MVVNYYFCCCINEPVSFSHWTPIPSFFKRLVILQKKCIRNACHVGYNAHTTPLCFKFKIIKLEDIYNVQIVTHYYNYFHKLLPENLNCANFVPINRDLHTYSTRQDSFIRSYGICRVDVVSANYRNILPKIVNALPSDLRHDLEHLSKQHFVFRLKGDMYLNGYRAFLCTNLNCYICSQSARQ